MWSLYSYNDVVHRGRKTQLERRGGRLLATKRKNFKHEIDKYKGTGPQFSHKICKRNQRSLQPQSGTESYVNGYRVSSADS